MALLVALAAVVAALVAVSVSAVIIQHRRLAEARRRRALDYERHPPAGLDYDYIAWLEQQQDQRTGEPEPDERDQPGEEHRGGHRGR